MNYYALIYDLVENMVERRKPFREEHLRLAREARTRGELVLAGSLAEPVDRALLVFCVDDKGKVESFARKDPYVTNGLVTRWDVRPWAVVVGNRQDDSDKTRASSKITRIWTARTSAAQSRAYLEHFSRSVLPALRKVEGYLTATVYTRRPGADVEILVETVWESLDAVRNFAGTDLEAAVVPDEAAALLTDFDRRVRHYEVALADSANT